MSDLANVLLRYDSLIDVLVWPSAKEWLHLPIGACQYSHMILREVV